MVRAAERGHWQEDRGAVGGTRTPRLTRERALFVGEELGALGLALHEGLGL